MVKEVSENVDRTRLLSFVERVERLEDEIAGLREDIKEIGAEAKGANYDFKTIKKLVKLRKKDKQTRDEEDFMLEQYKTLIGLN